MKILFKAKQKLDWHYGLLSSLKRHSCTIRENNAEFECDSNTLCRFTECVDTNSKEIFENDIVDFMGHIGVVKYECGSFMVCFKDEIDWDELEDKIPIITGCNNRLYACQNDNVISLWEIMWNFNDENDLIYTLKVIGNVFDNPELLD